MDGIFDVTIAEGAGTGERAKLGLKVKSRRTLGRSNVRWFEALRCPVFRVSGTRPGAPSHHYYFISPSLNMEHGMGQFQIEYSESVSE